MSRAGQYVGIYRDAIFQRHNKTDYRDIEILQQNRKYRNIFRVKHLKYMKYHEKSP